MDEERTVVIPPDMMDLEAMSVSVPPDIYASRTSTKNTAYEANMLGRQGWRLLAVEVRWDKTIVLKVVRRRSIWRRLTEKILGK